MMEMPTAMELGLAALAADPAPGAALDCLPEGGGRRVRSSRAIRQGCGGARSGHRGAVAERGRIEPRPMHAGLAIEAIARWRVAQDGAAATGLWSSATSPATPA